MAGPNHRSRIKPIPFLCICKALSLSLSPNSITTMSTSDNQRTTRDDQAEEEEQQNDSVGASKQSTFAGQYCRPAKPIVVPRRGKILKKIVSELSISWLELLSSMLPLEASFLHVTCTYA